MTRCKGTVGNTIGHQRRSKIKFLPTIKVIGNLGHTTGCVSGDYPMNVKTKKPIKKIAAIRSNLKRYGGYELKEWVHPERDDCYLFSITHPEAKNLIYCELVYSPDGNLGTG